MKRSAAIQSSKQASVEAAALDSIWSKESYLSLRTLIYCAELLEKILNRPAPQPKPKKVRTRSPWQEFLAIEMKTGSTITEAAIKWNAQKSTPPSPQEAEG